MSDWGKKRERAMSGDRESLADLLLGAAPELRKMAEALVEVRWQNYLSVDDLLQETFAEAILDLSSFRGSQPTDFVAWLKQICRHNYTDSVRHLTTLKKGADKRVYQNQQQSYSNLLEQVTGDSSAGSQLARAEEIEALQRAVEQLPVPYAQVVTRLDILGQPASDVARQLGCSLGAIYMRRTRALARLKTELRPAAD